MQQSRSKSSVIYCPCLDSKKTGTRIVCPCTKAQANDSNSNGSILNNSEMKYSDLFASNKIFDNEQITSQTDTTIFPSVLRKQFEELKKFPSTQSPVGENLRTKSFKKNSARKNLLDESFQNMFLPNPIIPNEQKHRIKEMNDSSILNDAEMSMESLFDERNIISPRKIFTPDEFKKKFTKLLENSENLWDVKEPSIITSLGSNQCDSDDEHKVNASRTPTLINHPATKIARFVRFPLSFDTGENISDISAPAIINDVGFVSSSSSSSQIIDFSDKCSRWNKSAPKVSQPKRDSFDRYRNVQLQGQSSHDISKDKHALSSSSLGILKKSDIDTDDIFGNSFNALSSKSTSSDILDSDEMNMDDIFGVEKIRSPIWKRNGNHPFITISNKEINKLTTLNNPSFDSEILDISDMDTDDIFGSGKITSPQWKRKSHKNSKKLSFKDISSVDRVENISEPKFFDCQSSDDDLDSLDLLNDDEMNTDDVFGKNMVNIPIVLPKYSSKSDSKHISKDHSIDIGGILVKNSDISKKYASRTATDFPSENINSISMPNLYSLDESSIFADSANKEENKISFVNSTKRTIVVDKPKPQQNILNSSISTPELVSDISEPEYYDALESDLDSLTNNSISDILQPTEMPIDDIFGTSAIESPSKMLQIQRTGESSSYNATNKSYDSDGILRIEQMNTDDIFGSEVISTPKQKSSKTIKKILFNINMTSENLTNVSMPTFLDTPKGSPKKNEMRPPASTDLVSEVEKLLNEFNKLYENVSTLNPTTK